MRNMIYLQVKNINITMPRAEFKTFVHWLLRPGYWTPDTSEYECVNIILNDNRIDWDWDYKRVRQHLIESKVSSLVLDALEWLGEGYSCEKEKYYEDLEIGESC